MGQINPFTAALAQTPQAQQLAAAERDAQIRRERRGQRATGLTDQSPDEYVESADAVEPVGNDRQHDEAPGRRKKPTSNRGKDTDDGKPHVDVRA